MGPLHIFRQRRRGKQFQRAKSRISPTVLSKRLDNLHEHGLIVRKRKPEQRGYEYQLTEADREPYPVVPGMAKWGMRWARGQMTDAELDVELLMSDIRRRIDPSRLPGGRTVIRFFFTDLEHYSRWRIKVEGQDVDLCVENPRYDVDVYVRSDLRTMVEIWMGDLSVKKARADGKLRIDGMSAYLKNVESWLGL